MKRLLAPVAMSVLCLATINCNGGGAGFPDEGNGSTIDTRQSTVSHVENKRIDSSPAKADLPLIDKQAVVGALPWIIDILELEKLYPRDDFQIDNYEISSDKRYAIVNISNGARSGTSGPFYRFLVFNPKAKRIFFPSMKKLRSENLGYPYIAARFNDRNQAAIAYGYRSIVASIVMLPEGQIMTKRELDLYDKNEIENALEHMLEKAQ